MWPKFEEESDTLLNSHRKVRAYLDTLNRVRLGAPDQKRIHEQIKFEVSSIWEPVKALGSGTYGDVYLFQHRQENITANSAIKRVQSVFAGDLHVRRALRELVILHHLRGHPNIASLCSVDLVKFSKFPGLYLYMESMDMDLTSVLRNADETLHDYHVSHISFQLLSAVHFMHSCGVVHRDLKPGNILITRNGVVKVCDFGMARGLLPGSRLVNYKDRDHYTDYVTTRWYRAPEILMRVDKYHFGIDMWSVGCIMAELVLRRPLFRGRSAPEQLALIVDTIGIPPYELSDITKETGSTLQYLQKHFTEQFPTRPIAKVIPSTFSRDFVDLLENILAYVPDKRTSAASALTSPFFDSVRLSCDDRFSGGAIVCSSLIDTSFEALSSERLLSTLITTVDKIRYSS